MEKKFSTQNKLIITIIVFLGFYVAFILISDINKISSEFLNIKIQFVFLSMLFTIFSLLVRSYRQKKFLDKLDIQIHMKKNISLFFSGMSMMITPLGAGELIKSHFLKRNYNEPISKTSPIIFLERFHDLLAVATILSFTLFLSYFWQGIVILGISFTLLIVLYLIVTNKSFLQLFQKNITKIKFLQRLLPNSEFYDTFSKLTNKKTTFTVWGISLVSFIFDAMAVYSGFLAFGQNFDFIEATGYYYASLLFGAISFLPVGIGITESSFVGFLVSHNVELSLASSIVLLTRLTTIWFTTIVGFITYHFVLKIKIDEKQD